MAKPQARWNAALVLSAASAMLVACIPNFDDDLSTIRAPRVLGIQSSPAEAAPGDVVTLSALLAAPDGSTSSLSWEMCLARKPLTELGPVSPECLSPSALDPDAGTPLGTGNSSSVMLPKDACQIFGPIRPQAVAGQAQGRPVDPDITGGYYQPLTAVLRASQEVTLGAVRLSCPLTGATPAAIEAFGEEYRPNQNPDFSSLDLQHAGGDAVPIAEGDSVTVQAGEAVRLQAAWRECPTKDSCGDGICGENEDKSNCGEDCTTPLGCTGAESYPVFDPISQGLTEHRESIRISWFASDGKFENPVTGRDEAELALTTENRWTAPSSAGIVRLWLVIRDARGGQSFRSFLVSVQR